MARVRDGSGWQWGLLLLVLIPVATVQAERISDIRSTKHNLSSLSGNSVRAAAPDDGGSDEVCVFCHTPHAANTQVVPSPLWNRVPSAVTDYELYSSTSLDYRDLYYALPTGSGFADEHQPNGNSKLCLSCHDGTVALGSMTNKPGSGGIGTDGNRDAPIEMIGTDTTTGVAGGVIAPSRFGEQSGFTRRIGTDLTNDHPISFTFDQDLAQRDGELHDPTADNTIVVGRARKGELPLQLVAGETKMQCSTCHDPHIRDDTATWNVKFLRQNRFQGPASIADSDFTTVMYSVPASNFENYAPEQGQFVAERDILCLACHDKAGWADSVHADPYAGDEVYKDLAADQREFPRGIRVWQAACMNCHDNHSVQGARRLLREGTCSGFEGDTGAEPGACSDPDDQIKSGGNPAVEETCYQCHTPNAKTILARKPVVSGTDGSSYGDVVPDIETEFLDGYRMPNTSDDQCRINGGTDLDCIAAGEVHSIGTGDGEYAGAEMLESRERMGLNNLENRHTECSDCHNPHRVTRNSWVTGDGVSQRTHLHTGGVTHTNVASGAQRGNWGIEPTFSGVWGSQQTDWIVKSGMPDGAANGVVGCSSGVADFNTDGIPILDACELEALRDQPYLTREYQLCLRCHSNYAYYDDEKWQGASGGSSRPALGNQGGGTPPAETGVLAACLIAATNDSEITACYDAETSNGLLEYTNQLTEFNVRADDYGNGTDQNERNNTTLTGASTAYDNTSNWNHRSWHPVHYPTARSTSVRFGSTSAQNWNEPWRSGVGVLTMYCSDCHGSAYGDTTCTRYTNNDPEDGCADYSTAPSRGVWGPHGSANKFLLRGPFTVETGKSATRSVDPGVRTSTGLCFNCHNVSRYAGSGEFEGSGFAQNPNNDNLHTWHKDAIDNADMWRCTLCHIAIPHGWKNKNFLANLNDIGREGGMSTSTSLGSNPPDTYDGAYTLYLPPYYIHALLSLGVFPESAQWAKDDCAADGGSSGEDWMVWACQTGG